MTNNDGLNILLFIHGIFFILLSIFIYSLLPTPSIIHIDEIHTVTYYSLEYIWGLTLSIFSIIIGILSTALSSNTQRS
jgi:hypothetical protein